LLPRRMTLILKSLLLVCSIALLASFAAAHHQLNKQPLMNYGGKQYTFTGQLINHFNPVDKRTFSQRYWVAEEFYVPSTNSPIIFYICGEATCRGTPSEGSFPYQMAQKAGALIVALEHRYYGHSQPFGVESMKTENMIYLTVEQALEDIAYFMQWFKVNYKYKINDSQPWITVGGSYPGALSAWFRYKYPHLTVGAWASSAVVNAILDFSQYDYQNFVSVSKFGQQCPRTIQALNLYFEAQLYSTSPDVQKKFKLRFGENALKLSNDELLWYISDSFVAQIQYGKSNELCAFLANYTNFDALVNATIQYCLDVNDMRMYGSYFVSNSTFDADMEDKIGRQWNYQICSQLGWFQTAATNQLQALRSQRINIEFYKGFCKNSFGKALWPDVDVFNNDFGGVGLVTTNVTIVNGCEDPWQWAAKNTTTGSMTSVFINCNGCAHCVDFHGPKTDDPETLKQAHDQIQGLVLGYLGKSSRVHITV
jgi:hypothetical protein